MGWAEIGLGPQAEARGTERRAGGDGHGAVVIAPERAKAQLHRVLGEFWTHGVWLAVAVVVAMGLMAMAGLGGAALDIALVLALAATVVVLAWARRVVRWGRHVVAR